MIFDGLEFGAGGCITLFQNKILDKYKFVLTHFVFVYLLFLECSIAIVQYRTIPWWKISSQFCFSSSLEVGPSVFHDARTKSFFIEISSINVLKVSPWSILKAVLRAFGVNLHWVDTFSDNVNTILVVSCCKVVRVNPNPGCFIVAGKGSHRFFFTSVLLHVELFFSSLYELEELTSDWSL